MIENETSKQSLRERIDVIMWINNELQKSEYNSEKWRLAHSALMAHWWEMYEIIQALVERLEKAEGVIKLYDQIRKSSFLGIEGDLNAAKAFRGLDRKVKETLEAISLEGKE